MVTAIPTPSGRRLRGAIFLLVLCLAALAARTLHYPQVFTEDGVLFFGVDPYYHVRRSLLTALDYPRLPISDAYAGYPRGMESHFAPLWDLMVATTARLQQGLGAAGGATPFSEREATTSLKGLVSLWSALYPPLLGMMTVLLCYRIARLFVPSGFAGLAALLLATAPAHVDYTLLGRPDHHVLESLLSSLAILLYLYLEDDRRGGKGGRTRLLLGLSLALAILSSAQCVLFLGLVTLDTLWRCRDPRKGGKRVASTLVSLSWAGAFLTVGLLLLAPHNLLRLHYDRPSLYQLAVLLAMLIPLLGIWIHRCGLVKTWLAGGKLAVGLGLVWAGLVLVLFSPTLSGVGFITGSPDWIVDVEDAYPLLFVDGSVNLDWVSGQLGWSWMGMPLWLFLVFLKPAPRASGPRTFLALWVVLTLGLSLYQVRFLYFFSLALACLVAAACYELYRLFDGVVSQATGPSRRGRVGLIAGGLVILMLSLLQYPTLPALWSRRHLVTIDPDVVHACRWLRENTPQTSFLYHPQSSPEYGVLTPWDLGNQVILLAERPAVATASHQANQQGISESVRFYLSLDEEDAVGILERNRARYVLFESRVGDFNVQGPLVGLPGPYSIEERVEGKRRYRFTEKHSRTLYSRAHLDDGVGSNGSLPLERLRLIYESPRSEVGFLGVHHIKIFELVPAALLKGYGRPGEEVLLLAQIRTNQGRSFQYRRRLKVSEDGSFALRWPYSNDPPEYYTRAEGSIQIHYESGDMAVSRVPEEAVLTGAELGLKD